MTLRCPLLRTRLVRSLGHLPDVGTVGRRSRIASRTKALASPLTFAEKTNGNRVSLPRTGPMRVEIGVSRAALRSGCKPRNFNQRPKP
jgi:hypothetical protein